MQMNFKNCKTLWNSKVKGASTFFDKNYLFSNVSTVFSKGCDISEMIFSWVKTKIILHILNLIEEDVELL